MARKIVVASGKGGVGKSTVSANLSLGAARLGNDTILLDVDVSMADVALVFGMDVDGPTLHEVLAEEADLSEAIYEGPEGLRIVPAGISIDGVRKAKPQGLSDVVEELSEMSEVLILDVPSGLGDMALTALRTGDEFIIVSNPIVTSLSDALRTKEVADRYGSEPLGVIVSRVKGDEVDVSSEEIESMLDLPILGEIPEDPKVRECTSLGKPVISKFPDSPSAKAFRKIISEIFEAEEEEESSFLDKLPF